MSNEDASKNNKSKGTGTKVVNGLLKGEKGFTSSHSYALKFNPSKSCVVSVLDKSIKGNNNWVIRFDKPHPNFTNFEHININPKISGIPDPHLKLPPGGLKAAEYTSKACNVINKVALPLTIAIDTVRVGTAIYKDTKRNSSRNTVEKLAEIGGGWGGGFGGAAAAAAIGTAIFPGVGTIVGGILGGICGGIGGTLAASGVTNLVADKFDYDIKYIVCGECQIVFRWKMYKEKVPVCPQCHKTINIK